MKIVNIVFYILAGILFFLAAFDAYSVPLLIVGPLFVIRGIIEIFRKN